MTTTNALPADIRVTTDGSAASIILPRPDIGLFRYAGYIPIAIGVVIIAFGLGWISFVVTGFLPMGARNIPWFMRIFMMLVACVGLMPIFHGCKFFYLGLFLLSRSPLEIRIDDRHLYSILRAGPLRRTWKCPLQQITGFRISAKPPGNKFQPDMPGAKGVTLYADTAKSKPFTVAGGYPQETLVALADVLANELHRRDYTNILRPTGPAGPVATPAVTVESASPPPKPPDETPDEPAAPHAQPAESKITFLPAPDVLTFIIPRTGFLGLPGFLLFFSLLWNAISWTFIGVIIARFIHNPDIENFLPIIFLSLFVAIGATIFLVSLQLALRKAVILAARSSLVYTQTGPLRKRELQWTPDQLQAIRVELSGTTVNDRALKEIRVYSTDGKYQGFFDGRDERELAWLAGTLCNFYALHRKPQPANP